ncbi:MAG: hypothetical protein ACU83O_09865 [Gammaproteobacteria bacterium]
MPDIKVCDAKYRRFIPLNANEPGEYADVLSGQYLEFHHPFGERLDPGAIGAMPRALTENRHDFKTDRPGTTLPPHQAAGIVHGMPYFPSTYHTGNQAFLVREFTDALSL